MPSSKTPATMQGVLLFSGAPSLMLYFISSPVFSELHSDSIMRIVLFCAIVYSEYDENDFVQIFFKRDHAYSTDC